MRDRWRDVPEPAELSSPKAKFEHLFPGCSWESLTTFNPSNLSSLPALLGDTVTDDFWKAFDAKQGFAKRISLARPDKAIVGLHMLRVDESWQKTPHEWHLSDFLNEGEILGGAAAWPFNRDTDGINMEKGTVVGVLGNDGKPKGLIVYSEGPRDKKIKKVKESKRSLIPPLRKLVPGLN